MDVPKKSKSKHLQTNPDTWDEEEEAVISKEQADAQRIAGRCTALRDSKHTD